MDVSSSTVRNELAELEALGLLMHPHTSAGRVPTESGYRVYAEELVDTLDGRREKLPLEIAEMRNELEAALQSTTETLSHATRLLALVSAPAIGSASVRHVDVLQLQPRAVIVVVITSTGGVTKRVLELEDPADPGLVEWARTYLEDQLIGLGLGSSTLRRRLEDPALPSRERDFLDCCGRRSSTRSATTARGCSSAAPPGCSVMHGAPSWRLPATARCARAARGGAGAALGRARSASHRRPRRARRSKAASCTMCRYVGARYGLASRSLGSVALLGPLRMDYEKAIRTVRAAAFELSRLVEDVYEGV